MMFKIFVISKYWATSGVALQTDILTFGLVTEADKALSNLLEASRNSPSVTMTIIKLY